MSARSLMVHRCTIERGTRVSDGGGGFTVTWNAVATDVPCRAWFLDASIAPDGDRPTVVVDHTAIVPVGTDVEPGDRIAAVTDKAGVVLFPGPLEIDTVGRRADHWQLYARTIT